MATPASEDISSIVAELQADVRELKRRRAPPSPSPDAMSLLKAAASMVANLREENRQLKLRAFWADFNLSELCEVVMAQRKRPACLCHNCGMTARRAPARPPPPSKPAAQAPPCGNWECSYFPWIINLVREGGMTVSEAPCSDKLIHPHSCGLAFVSAQDVHFAFSPNLKLGLTMGAKLWKAQSTDDPELEKLAKLFVRVQGVSVEPFDYTELLVDMIGGVKYEAGKWL